MWKISECQAALGPIGNQDANQGCCGLEPWHYPPLHIRHALMARSRRKNCIWLRNRRVSLGSSLPKNWMMLNNECWMALAMNRMNECYWSRLTVLSIEIAGISYILGPVLALYLRSFPHVYVTGAIVQCHCSGLTISLIRREYGDFSLF